MKKSISLLISIFILFSLVACSNSKDEPQPPRPEQPVHRTILVYMVATNNLHSEYNSECDYDHLDIEEIRKAAANGGLNGGRLLVYHVYGDEAPRLIEIKKDGTETVLQTYPAGTISVSSEQMSNVLEDVKVFAPAEEYGIVLWSHGSGWLEDGIESAAQDKLRSFGLDGRSAKMNVSTLAQVLEGRNLAFIYFDCCYMGTVEVMYELKNCAPYIVASASELPVYGMDYTLNVPCFFKKGQADLKSAIKNTFDSYDSREGVWRTCTIALIETSGLDALAQAARDVYSTVDFPHTINGTPQRYAKNTRYYYDFADYLSRIPASEESLTALNNALNHVVTAKYATPYIWPGDYNSVRIDSYCGLSGFIVNNKSDIETKNYRNLRWYRDVVSTLVER